MKPLKGWGCLAEVGFLPIPVEIPAEVPFNVRVPDYPDREMSSLFPKGPLQDARRHLETLLAKFIWGHHLCTRVVLQSFLVHDRPGYAIGPHTDTPQKIATGMIYLRGPGTTLYHSDCADAAGEHLDADTDWKPLRTMLPQEILLFQRTDHSWHGVPKASVQRYSLMTIAWRPEVWLYGAPHDTQVREFTA